MSLKNDINMVKNELNSEEKFFEKAVITEKFVKKYKNLMIGSLVVVVAVVGSNIAYDINKQNKIESANQILLTLSTNSDNTQALKELKDISPSLYDVWLLSKAIVDKDVATLKELKNSRVMLVGDLSKYELAQNSKNLDALNDYASKQNSIYRELAQVQSAVMLMHEGKTLGEAQDVAGVSFDETAIILESCVVSCKFFGKKVNL